MLACPNKSSAEWKYLVEKLGERDAYKFFMANEGAIPKMLDLMRFFGDDALYERPVASLVDDGDNAFEMKKARFGPVKNIKDLNEYFKNNTQSVKSFEQFSEDEFADSLMSTIRINGGVFSYAGKDYDFKSSSDAQISKIIKEEILPDMKSFEKDHKKRIIEWIDNGANLSQLPGYFPGKIAGISKFNENVMMGLVQRYMDHNISTKYYLYSDIKNNPELQQLGIVYDQVFEGYDPIIAVHESSSGEINLSIFDTTTMPLTDRGINQDKNNLFANFGYGDFRSYLNNVSLKNTEGGIRQFYAGLLAMRLKHSNKNINIKDVAVLGLYKNNIDPRYVIMQSDFIPSIQAIRNIKPFMDLIPEEVKKVINNKNLDSGKFDQPFVAAYRAFLITQMENTKKLYDGNEAYVIYEKEAINMMDALQRGMSTPDEFVDMLKNRMAMLQSKNQDKAGVFANEEYQKISQILAESRYGSLQTNKKDDTSWMGHMLKNLFDTQSDLVQWARNEINRALSFVSEKLFAFKKEHNKQIEKLASAMQGSGYWSVTQKTKERTLDAGGDRFKRLFKKRMAKDDKTGAQVEITTNEIHWNEKDEETRKTLSNGQITKAEVAYGAWIVEKIRDMYIDLIVHDNRFMDRMQKLTSEQRLDKAKMRYQAEWKDGLIPVVQKSFSEKVASMDGKGGIKQFWREMGNMDMLYHDQQYGEEDKANMEVFNGFLSELGSTGVGSHKSYLGSSQRLDKMGLVYDAAGQISVVNMDKNKNVSTNLENIMDYFMLMGIRKQKLDKDVLPMVNAARSLLYALEKNEGIKQEYNSKLLEVIVDRLVHGKKQKDTPLGIDVDPVVNTALSIAAFNGLAMNVPLWAASFLMNQTQTWTFAIANGISKNGKFFTQKEAAQAMQMITTSPKEWNKMFALMQFYQVADMSERDLVNNPRHKKFGKQLYKSHYMHYGGWATDYTARGWVMVAQMLFDGSYDAHSVDEEGNVKYDPKKDKRFYKNGVATADGKVLMDAIKQKAVEDGSEEAGKPLTRGYNYEYARQFKYIADKYIIGGMDATTYGAIESVFWGRMLTQFKKYLSSKFYNAFGREIVSKDAITPEIYTNDAGERVVRWNGNIVKGYFQTMLRMAKDLRKVKEMGLSAYWVDMKPEEKYNVAKMSMDLAMFSIMIGLYAGLTADWDDDKKEDFLKDSRMLRTFKYAGLDLMPFAPWTILKSIDNPMPIVDQSLRLFNIVVGDTREWERAVPGSATYQVIDETFGLSEE